jgi:hypothetical protein
MFRESNFDGTVSKGKGSDSVLRHPDGTINFDAYRAAGRRAREAAIVESIKGAASFARSIAPSPPRKVTLPIIQERKAERTRSAWPLAFS